MRLEVAGEVLAIVAALMVVLDLQIAVTPQALRDHQVMRLVARGEERGAGRAAARPLPATSAVATTIAMVIAVEAPALDRART